MRPIFCWVTNERDLGTAIGYIFIAQPNLAVLSGSQLSLQDVGRLKFSAVLSLPA